MKKLTVLIFVAASISFIAHGQALNTPKLDSLLHSLASRDLAMGSLTISKNGAIQYQKAIGYSYIDEHGRRSADTSTKYRIGSVTKMFTAVMIFQLVEEQKIGLDHTLSVYFPSLANSNRITIANMLYHRSGLHDYTRDSNFPEWMEEPKTPDDLLKLIQEAGSDFEPGTKVEYSNSNYLLLGYIIEKICQMPYADVVNERIISKLDMEDTYYGSQVSVERNESASYKFSNGSWNRVKEEFVANHGGAGALISTSTDMIKFIDALFSNELIGASSLVKMQTIIDGYGMGFLTNEYGSKTSYGHNGRVEEHYSSLWYFPTEKVSFAYCTNGINYPRTDILEGILKICFDEAFTIPFANSRVGSQDLDMYLGRYSSGDIVVNCTKNGTRLLLETRGKVFEAEKISDNYFMNAAYGYYFEFDPAKDELQVKETDNIYYLKRDLK